jgi:hypothetical protein
MRIVFLTSPVPAGIGGIPGNLPEFCPCAVPLNDEERGEMRSWKWRTLIGGRASSEMAATIQAQMALA